jgi:hypothetical protein
MSLQVSGMAVTSSDYRVVRAMRPLGVMMLGRDGSTSPSSTGVALSRCGRRIGVSASGYPCPTRPQREAAMSYRDNFNLSCDPTSPVVGCSQIHHEPFASIRMLFQLRIFVSQDHVA